jgi:hypothetical protein
MPLRRRIDTVLDPTFVESVRELSLGELRERRKLADEEEVEQSFVRRVLQGKLDLLRAELRVRAGEAHSLIESLPEVLADDGPRPQFGRLPRYFQPGQHPWGRRPGDHLVTDDALSRLEELREPEIEHLIGELQMQERQVSEVRRKLHAVIDMLQGEMTRRYAEGEASVDQLLTERTD